MSVRFRRRATFTRSRHTWLFLRLWIALVGRFASRLGVRPLLLLPPHGGVEAAIFQELFVTASVEGWVILTILFV